jgi:hypothetical protein
MSWPRKACEGGGLGYMMPELDHPLAEAMMGEKEANTAAPGSEPSRAAEKPASMPAAAAGDRPETVTPPNWAPNMLVYGDISRMLFRMHRNVAAHMDAHKRLAERMQAVFAHEQAMVLELARLIDESMTVAARKSNEEKPPLGGDSIERIFDHASNAMKETGRMLTDIQLESLALLQRYIEQPSDAGASSPAPSGKPETKKGAGKE